LPLRMDSGGDPTGVNCRRAVRTRRRMMRIGIPIVVYKISISHCPEQRGGKEQTYIDRQIQQVETTRIRPILPLLIHQPLYNLQAPKPRSVQSPRHNLRSNAYAKLPTRQQTHAQIRNMHQNTPHNLFTRIEKPDLDRPLRSFPPSLIYECGYGQESERALHEDREGA
jgi:hypothetical protein